MLEVVNFKPFVGFLLEFRDELIQEPIRGKLNLIHSLYTNYAGHGKKKEPGFISSIQEFTEYLIQFSGISGNALEFDVDLRNYDWEISRTIFSIPLLVGMDVQRLLILRNRFDSMQFKEAKFKDLPQISVDQFNSTLDCFRYLLHQPLQTTIKEISSDLDDKLEVNVDIPTLDLLLDKPTASIQLAQEKAKLKTPVKPYYEICDDLTHSHVLSGACFNKKELIKQSLPEVAHIHKIIQQNRNTISQEIIKCSQTKIHYLPILNNHTDLYLGDCSYLDTCHKMKTCRYLHYYSLNPLASRQTSDEQEREIRKRSSAHDYTVGECYTEYQRKPIPAQWINCDVRYLPFLILGKFAVIVSDPAWDIHMSLPYGTCKDFELLSLPMHELQDEGIIVLWVTGRAIEIGRQALQNWGYTIADEMIWIKLNQLKRTIVTGRTGHWLNHSKEHLLVGIKGNPPWINRLMDTDVVVSGTRETLRKPDEIYDVVERIVGTHSRKLEIFGRDHNIRPGWLSMYTWVLIF